jgi:outer membrane protein assembly factor BamB
MRGIRAARLLFSSLIFTLFLSTPSVAEKVWRVDLPKTNWDRLASNGCVLASSSNGLTCYDGGTGAHSWTRKDFATVPGAGVWDLRTAPYFLVDPGEGKKRRKKDPVPIKEIINANTGETVFTLAGLQGNLRGFVPVPGAGIALAITEVKVKDKNASGIYVAAYELPTGKLRWRTKYGDRKAKISAFIHAYPNPKAQDGVLYLSYLGTHALDVQSGQILWGVSHSPIKGSLRRAVSAPVIADGVAYFSTGKLFQAVDARSGTPKWSAKLKRSPAVSEIRITRHLVVARLGGVFTNGSKLDDAKPLGVVAYNKSDGQQAWFYPDAEGGLTDLMIDEADNLVAFADGAMIVGLRLSSGAPLFETAIQYFRLYGIFEEESGGFSVSGSYSKSGPGGSSGGGGGLGMFSSGMDLEDLPLDSDRLRHDVIIRGRHHILAYDPELRIIQWSTLFGDAELTDPQLQRTGLLPGWSAKGRSYYLTIMEEGRGRRLQQILTLFGVDPLTDRIVSRQSIEGKKPRFFIDAERDRLIRVYYDKKKKSTAFEGYDL